VIPVLLLEGRNSLVKTREFSNPVYIGDPLNAVKIFNEKETDELIVLDITASREKEEPDYHCIEQIATECFMPVTYGGGVRSTDQFRRVIACGIEKVAMNTAVLENPELISEAASHFGSSSVVVSIDIRKNWLNQSAVYSHTGLKSRLPDPLLFAKRAEELGAGEILFQSVNRDGAMNGYDLDWIRLLSTQLSIPLIACGGAGGLEHFAAALVAGASAVAAGSKFVFWGKHRAVLINYLSQQEINQLAALTHDPNPQSLHPLHS
jgi:cyclase